MKNEISKETGAEKELFIYLCATGDRVPVSKEVYEAYYGDVRRIRDKESYYGRCFCPKKLLWKCDGDCLSCPFHKESDELSLNVPGADEEGEEWGDSFADPGADIESAVETKLMLQKVIARLRELDPEADRMLAIWSSEEDISDREMARRLGRTKSGYARQILRYRNELKKIF